MSTSNSAYRKDRYYHNTAHKKGKFYFIISIFGLFGVIIALASLVYLNKQDFEEQLVQKDSHIKTIEEELSWLRTINPFQGDYTKIEELAVSNSDLFPGWIARVYPVPDSPDTPDSSSFSSDVGTFVMNETRFSLASHRRYGITEQSKSMYLLSGLLPSTVKGRHQVGLKINVIESAATKSAKGISKIGSCHSKFFVNQKRVIDKRISFMGNNDLNDIHVGDVSLGLGIYPMSLMVYCDKKSEFSDDEIEISVLFREPNEQTLAANRYNVFHIYKPERPIKTL